MGFYYHPESECYFVDHNPNFNDYDAIEVDFDFNKIPLDDPEVYRQFSSGNTVGIFQFSGDGMSYKIIEMKPENITDLIILNAGYRPGALRSGMLDLLIERKHGKKYKIDKRLKEILEETYGIMIFQEQIMQVAITAAGFSPEQADKLRKVIAKSKGKEEIEKFQNNFIEQSNINGFKGDKLWDEIVEFAAYGFNKGHSTSYALNAYWCMWLKVHYPKEFMLSLLTYSSDDTISKHVEEAKRLGFYISTPKTEFSKAEKWIEKNDIFYAPYNTIKSIGEKVAFEAEKIKRTGFFKTSVKTKSQKLLRDAGCYSDNHDPNLFNFKPSKPKRKETNYRKLYPNLFKICPEFFPQDTDDILKGKFPGEFKNPIEKFYFIKRIKLKEEIKCIIAGSRSFDDFEFLKEKTDIFLSKFTCNNKLIISGTAKGADKLGEKYSHEKNLKLIKMPADWEEHGKKAGYLRNAEMANIATHCIIFRENNSKGSTHMINIAKNKKLNIQVYDDFKKGEFKNNMRCTQCNLESKNQLKTSTGKYNVFIINDTPKNDIKPLWKYLKKYGLYKKHFHVSSICRCPSDTPNKSQIVLCSQKVINEIKQIKCRLALVFGDVGYKAFTGKTGVVSGKCQWLEKYGFWSIFCSHPSDIFNGKENFEKGIEKFIEMFEKML
jgi:hypothetical protein